VDFVVQIRCEALAHTHTQMHRCQLFSSSAIWSTSHCFSISLYSHIQYAQLPWL